MPRKRDIVCLSTNYWDGEWFRKQQFMSRLAREGHRILFVEPSYSLVRRFTGGTYARNRLLTHVLWSPAERVTVLTPPRRLPCARRPFISRIERFRLGRIVARSIRRLGMETPVLWIYDVESAPLIRRVPHSSVILDLVDDLVAYEVTPERREHVLKVLRSVVSMADASVFTTAGLQKLYGDGMRSVVVPNGFDGGIFDGETRSAEIPAKGRLIGFIGTLFRHLDFELLQRVAEAYPEDSLVLVGRVAGAEGQVESLTRLSNVVHVPVVARDKVPEYIAAFDVCLVPFLVNDLSANVSPLKAYEYLAMGKPVVSTRMPGLAEDPAAKDVIFADDMEDFVRLVGQALNRLARTTMRPGGAISASWDGRFEQLVSSIGDLLETT